MRQLLVSASAAALVLGVAVSVLQPTTAQTPPAGAITLRPISAFASITDPRARSVALFQEAGKVLLHPRCVNCHPAGDRPLQTDAMLPHQPLVVRGPSGHGAVAMECRTCHHASNYDPARVPGHVDWHVAPIEMAWQGKSLAQICDQIKNRAHNGGKDMEALLHHMEADSLVGWGWSPGAGRTSAPGSQKVFGELMRAWADAGAHCPGS